jgi:drug/metabolite transporter (DMT)-like permease
VSRARPGGTLIAAGLVVMWSSGYIGSELGTRHAPATALLAWRYIVVASLLGVWMLLRRPRVTRRDLAVHALIGALAHAGCLSGTVTAAEHGVSAGTIALIMVLQPIVATALAAPLLREAVTSRQVAGLGLGLAGVAAVVSADVGYGSPTSVWAYALPAAAMLSLVAATLLERRTRPSTGAVDALTIQCAVSALLFAALAGATGTLTPPAGAGFWVAVAWVAVLATLGGYGLYWANLARSGVTRVSALLYLTPPATTAWAWLMFGDPMTVVSLTGMAVCAAAVALVTAPGRPAVRAAL